MCLAYWNFPRLRKCLLCFTTIHFKLLNNAEIWSYDSSRADVIIWDQVTSIRDFLVCYCICTQQTESWVTLVSLIRLLNNTISVLNSWGTASWAGVGSGKNIPGLVTYLLKQIFKKKNIHNELKVLIHHTYSTEKYMHYVSVNCLHLIYHHCIYVVCSKYLFSQYVTKISSHFLERKA